MQNRLLTNITNSVKKNDIYFNTKSISISEQFTESF